MRPVGAPSQLVFCSLDSQQTSGSKSVTIDLDLEEDSEGWKPHCPKCCRLLDGQLVASSCNHVFHKACIPDDGDLCPKCQQPIVGTGSSDLYGLNFGDAGTTDCNGCSVAQLPKEAREAAAETCVLGREVEKQKQKAHDLREHLEDEKIAAEKQRVSRVEAEKVRASHETKNKRCSDEIEKVRAQRNTLQEQVQQDRERSAVAEYYQMLQNSTDGGSDALAFLSKMTDGANDPARLLTEVSRLRDYHRANIQKLQKERVMASQLESRNRREIAEIQSRIAAYQKELHREDAQSGNTSTGLTMPDAKHARIIADPSIFDRLGC